ncbi:MAG: SDR family oxidoreductase [Deltaproteobacteria bacterium]|jgi:NAD(P)-dependent dehydrogenase (short-subunit alcohol dehydrogenase family)|nr:SDR family oxidoreductase [Deltaproteobacteria bacterium]MBW2499581.1 SDR family oxidoreductase [Deltaproteobacteria bacterium]
MMLQGKAVVVAGVGDGLGSQIGRLALREGANVVLAARSGAKLDEIAARLDPSGDRVLAVPTDITDESQCQRLADSAAKRFGRIDAVTQVAALDRVFGGLAEVTREEWMNAYELGVVGSAQLVSATAPHMKKTGAGSVIFIGSQSSFIPLVPQIAYAAAKGALSTAMYFMANELARDNIRVNTVVATYMWGPALEGYVKETAEARGISEDEVVGELTAQMPLGRIPKDEDVAEAVVFFASDRASTITGQHLLVNSGLMMR